MGTENVNTTMKGNVLNLLKDEFLAKKTNKNKKNHTLVYIHSYTYFKHMLHSCSSSSNPGFRECKLACLLHLQHHLVAQPIAP